MEELVKAGLPVLGSLLGGPFAGMAITAIEQKLGLSPQTIKTVDEAVKAVQGASPEQMLALQQAEYEFKLKMQELTVKSDQQSVDVITQVNTTMQTEAKSDHWPTYAWRPYIGISFGSYINSMWLLPLFHVQPVILTPEALMAIGGILGVASWFRGKMQSDPKVLTDNRG